MKNSSQVFFLCHFPTECFGQRAFATPLTASDEDHAIAETWGRDPEHAVCQGLSAQTHLQVRQSFRNILLHPPGKEIHHIEKEDTIKIICYVQQI